MTQAQAITYLPCLIAQIHEAPAFSRRGKPALPGLAVALRNVWDQAGSPMTPHLGLLNCFPEKRYGRLTTQVGLLVSSPIFAEASKHVNAFRLIAVGLGIWTLSTAGCGVSVGFWSLILCRMLVGVGEASFVALASPFIGGFTISQQCLLGSGASSCAACLWAWHKPPLWL